MCKIAHYALQPAVSQVGEILYETSQFDMQLGAESRFPSPCVLEMNWT